MNKWTQVLLGVGLVSIPAVTHAEEQLSQLRTELTSTTISGYVDTTYTYKFGEGNANMPGRTYDGGSPSYNHDGFNLNVVSITFAKPLDESEWSAGYLVQTLMGPGAAKRGTRSVIGGQAGDFSFNEAVVLLRVPIGNGIDFKIGQFGTYNGYEAYDTYKNPNWSRSYGFYIESSAHTGVSASYKITDSLTIMGGVANMAGWNNQVDAYNPNSETSKAFLGMVTYTLPEGAGFLKGASVSAGYTGGVNGNTSTPPPAVPFSNGWKQENYYLGLSLPTPINGLAVGLALDYTKGINAENNYSEAFAAYVTYQATEKLKLNGRADFAKGDNGTFGYTSGPAGDGNNQLFSFTCTADYALWKNVISRLELRWDTCMSDDTPFGGTIAPNATPPGDQSATSLTANFIYQF